MLNRVKGRVSPEERARLNGMIERGAEERLILGESQGIDVFLINLEGRGDKLSECRKIFNELKFFNLNIFKAVPCSKGYIGCALSHLLLIDYARRKGLKNIIVVEDDVEFMIGGVKIERMMKNLMNTRGWRIFNGNPSQLMRLRSRAFPFNEQFMYLSQALHTTFMVYNESCYEEMLKYNYDRAIDGYISANFRQLVCRRVSPVNQRTSMSDIDKKEKNRKILYLRDNVYLRRLLK